MKGPILFWTLVLGGIAAVLLTLSALSPGEQDRARPAETLPTALADSPPAPVPQTLDRRSATAPNRSSAPSEATSFVADDPWDSPAPEPVPVSAGLSPAEAAARIAGTRPALVIIFSTGCPLSQRAFPDFVRVSRAIEGRVSVLAFATDSDAARVDRFLASHGAGFAADLLGPRQPGELSHAMGQVGISIGTWFTMPLIAVVGPRGEVLGKWEAQTDLGPVAATIHRMRL